LQLKRPLASIPVDLANHGLALAQDGNQIVYRFDAQSDETGIADLLRKLDQHGIDFKELQSSQSSLEDIFVSLVHGESTGREGSAA
jgi:ABC-2 type transport system ATP-binding protein